jgi:hypothetical protein
MHGHVFQLAAEAHKPDQYTKTMDALAKYVAVEMTPHGKDLVSLFANPPTEPVLVPPTNLPPIILGSVATKELEIINNGVKEKSGVGEIMKDRIEVVSEKNLNKEN